MRRARESMGALSRPGNMVSVFSKGKGNVERAGMFRRVRWTMRVSFVAWGPRHLTRFESLELGSAVETLRRQSLMLSVLRSLVLLIVPFDAHPLGVAPWVES